MGNVATLDDRVILRDCIFPGLCMGAGSIDLLQSTRSLHTLLEVFESLCNLAGEAKCHRIDVIL